MKRYASIAAVKKANRAYAKSTGRAYWFGPGEMRFFNTRIHGALIGGKYFVTSERPGSEYPWRWSVREAERSGRIETLGEFRGWGTLESAKGYAKRLAAMEKGVPDNPVHAGYDRDTISKNISLLIREGRDDKEAAAIAYSSARASWRRRFANRAFPSHLRKKGAVSRAASAIKKKLQRYKVTLELYSGRKKVVGYYATKAGADLAADDAIKRNKDSFARISRIKKGR